MITEKLDQLIEYVTRNNSSDYIIEAKQEYQKIAGEIYEDDKFYENRMGLFLEWFIFDRLMPIKNLTLIESMTNGNTQLALENFTVFKDFSQSIHSLFIIKKIRQDDVIVQDLFSGEKYEVNEPQSKIIFQPKDIFDGRVLPFEGEGGGPGGHPEVWDLSERADDLLGDAIAEELVVGAGAHVGKQSDGQGEGP